VEGSIVALADRANPFLALTILASPTAIYLSQRLGLEHGKSEYYKAWYWDFLKALHSVCTSTESTFDAQVHQVRMHYKEYHGLDTFEHSSQVLSHR